MRRLIVALAVAGAAFGIATAVQASIPDSQGIVHSCYNTSRAHGTPTGAMRAIDTDRVDGNCASWEGAVDLATPQYVQNVVTSTVNQTAITGTANFTLGAGNWWVNWYCGGWVATDPTIGPVPSGTLTAAITGHGSANIELQDSGFPGTNAKVYFGLSATTTVHAQVTCVDPRVYGETAPVAAPTKLTATTGS